jgi:hypothetical protein
VKLRIRTKHQTRVLTGEAARSYLRQHQPSAIPWATTVARCTCGWHYPAIHGETAEAEAARHAAKKAA